MPRDWSTDLQNIHQAYKRRDTLDLYLADDTVLRLSRGKVIRNIGGSDVTYDNWIRSVEDLRGSIEQSIDRITIKCQNINSQLGFKLASDLRLLDFAVADYGKIYQSLTNPTLIEDIPQVLRGVLANAEVDEQNFKVELIVDYDSMGRIIAARAMSPRGQWCHQNGIECTSAVLGDCPQTRIGCARRGREYEHGGWEDFEEPVTTPPGSGGNEGGGIGGPCFVLNTRILTPNGEVPFGDLPLGVQKERCPVVSFDKITGEINTDDEFEEIWEYEVKGCYTLEFQHDKIDGVTPMHRFFYALGKWRTANDFQLGQTTKAFGKDWFDSKLVRMKWNSDKSVKVRNGRVKHNGTYFANSCGVSNSKSGDIVI
ncbi:MAG: hypothetical protein ABWZ66_00720 [Pyrinomonadaceae bacterium]